MPIRLLVEYECSSCYAKATGTASISLCSTGMEISHADVPSGWQVKRDNYHEKDYYYCPTHRDQE